jgi:DNA (cytosine-5)-methyltransferase 1
MTAYYNEIDPYAAQWLRNLIDAGHLARGDVDTRSIVDVRADDLRGYVQCHFFAGIGGWSYALRLAGWPDDRAVWTGSCPCQPFSGANKHARGKADERHLWPDLHRLTDERVPPVLFGEQIAREGGPGWFAGVRSDLEASGYSVAAANLPACGVGSPQERGRLWFVAVGIAESLRRREGVEPIARTQGRGQASGQSPWSDEDALGADGRRRRARPGTRPVGHGIPARIPKLRAIGNSIVPQVAAEFIGAAMTALSVSSQDRA